MSSLCYERYDNGEECGFRLREECTGCCFLYLEDFLDEYQCAMEECDYEPAEAASGDGEQQ